MSMSLSHDMWGAPLCFPPAAIRTMLPEVCELQTVVVEVLPSMAKDLTLPGPTALSGPVTFPLLLIVTGILLTMTSGLPEVPSEVVLCMWTAVSDLGFLLLGTTRMFGIPFPSTLRAEIMVLWPNLLVPTVMIELATLPPPTALQLTIIMLLTFTVLLLSARRISSDESVIRSMAPQLIQSILTIDLGLVVWTVQLLPTFAEILPAAFPLMMAVFKTGTLDPLIIMFPILQLVPRVSARGGANRYTSKTFVYTAKNCPTRTPASPQADPTDRRLPGSAPPD